MERKKSPLRKTDYSKIDIFLEDIKELQKYLTKISDDIKIETKEYVFESWEDLYTHTEKINNLHIASRTPYIDLDISKDYYSIDCSWTKDENMTKYFHELGDIFENYKRKQLWIFNKEIDLTISLFLVLGSIGYFFHFFKMNNTITILYFIGLIYILVNMLFYKKPNRVYLKYKTEVRGFWVRKKEDIYVAILSGLVIAVLSFFGGLVAQYYLKIFNNEPSTQIHSQLPKNDSSIIKKE